MNKFISLLACLFGLAHVCDAGTVTANFTSASTVPVTAASYDATGNDVALSLGFAPPTGTNLTVVNNTGLPFILGQFSNLAQGQKLNLSYDGITYKFVANYYGGSGNDLVLHWDQQDLAAWGYNTGGALGNGGITDSLVPVLVNRSGILTNKTVVQLSAGGARSLALCSDGTLVQWGSVAPNEAYNVFPVEVPHSGVLAGKSVISVSAGISHSLVLCSDGTMAAWGSNSSGRLGNGSTANSSVPVLVTPSNALNGKTVVAISAGEYCSLALCSDGTIVTWGWLYTIWNGSTGSIISSTVPVAVNGSGVLLGKVVVEISAGGNSCLVLCSDGTVVQWGGSYSSNGLPYVFEDITNSGALSGKTVVDISAGKLHSLALCSDGTVAAWGYGYISYGELGDGTTSYKNEPVLVARSGVLMNKNVISVSAGEYYSLALCSDGTAAAWGRNNTGQLGNSSTTNSNVPVQVDKTGLLASRTVISLDAGRSHSLALTCIESSPYLSNLSVNAGPMNPHFSTFNASYNASVLYAVTSITVRPTSAVNNAVIRVNGSPVKSGFYSQTIPLDVGPNLVTIGVVAPDGITSKTYTINIIRQPRSSVATLSELVPSSGTMNPLFASSTTSYSSSVGNAQASISVRPTVTDTTASIRVNGNLVASGSNSAAIPLTVGTNTITVLVTAQDGVTTSTYTLIVNRAPSSVATLAGLVPSSGSLSPAFAPGITSYTASVANAITSIAVRPTVTNTTATTEVNGVTVTSESNSSAIPLTVGTNTITVLVTAQDGVTRTTYTLTVSRAPSSISTLSNLMPGSGSLSPGFASGTKSYSATVNTNTWAVTPSVTDHTATLTVNGTPVVSGNGSAPIPLSIGSNTISIVIKAQDGVTQSTYTITVTRLSTVSTLSGLVLDSGSLSPTFAPRTLAYSALAGNSTASIKVTPTSTDSYASVTVNGSTVASGSSSNSIPLVAGPNTIQVIATAQDGSSTTYTLTVTRDFMDITFIAPGTAPLSASSYDATGNAVNLALAFAPSIGTNLTLLDNAGLGFITGRFSNLAQGQTLNLTYQGITYRFVADYYGGSGNDLVLKWAENKTYAWGANSRGQLGSGTTSNSSMPVAVMNSGILFGKTILAISTGSSHSLALCSDGMIAAWGYNFHGQLGDGRTTDSSVPVEVIRSGVLAGKTVVAVSAGFFHSIALCSDGTVAAWGYNLYGQLGNNSTVSSSLPVRFRALVCSVERPSLPSRRVITTTSHCARMAPWFPGGGTTTVSLATTASPIALSR